MNMYLQLTHEDVEVLRRALAVRLDELRRELAHSDARAYRDATRQELNCLEKIDLQLAGPGEAKRPA